MDIEPSLAVQRPFRPGEFYIQVEDLVGVVHIFDRPEKGLGNRVVVLESCVELEQ